MIVKKVSEYVREHHMLAENDYVAAGVSGGADSVCLLFLLRALQKEIPFQLHAVHVNHLIRPDAGEDAAYVEELCRALDVPFTLVERDVETLAKQRRLSVEETGREVRYEAFARVLAERAPDGCGKIAVAHNKNDCGETFLFHLFRGSGLKGLCGIPPVRGNVIRPLLCLERHEIEEFLRENGIKYCIDRTNLEDNYTRNKIRHQILETAAREISPAAAAHIYDACGKISEACLLLDEMTERAYLACVSETDGGVSIDGAGFAGTHETVRGYVVMKALAACAGSRKNLETVHVEQVKALFERQCGKKIHLPYGLCAERGYTGVRIFRMETAADGGAAAENAAWEYVIDGAAREKLSRGERVEIRLDGGQILTLCVKNAADMGIEKNNEKNIPQKKYTKWLDYDKIKDSIVVRHRKEGDYLTIDAPRGEIRRKTLKAYLIDSKVPKAERGTLFLVAEGSHILWIAGGRISSFYKVGGSTERILELTLTKI